MAENKKKEKHITLQKEKHDTAAWANQNQLKAVSKVNLPDEIQVRNAKEYVDQNQK